MALMPFRCSGYRLKLALPSQGAEYQERRLPESLDNTLKYFNFGLDLQLLRPYDALVSVNS